MHIGRGPRLLLIVPTAAALLGGAVCVLLLNTDLPYEQRVFLLFPVLAAGSAVAILRQGLPLMAALPAGASTGFCTTAITTWLWDAQVFRCSRGVMAHIMRIYPHARPYLTCAWSPDDIRAVTLPVALAASVAVLIFSAHRQRDWLPWAGTVYIFTVFAFRAYWTHHLGPAFYSVFPDWATLILLLIPVLAIGVIGAWRIGRATTRRADVTS